MEKPLELAEAEFVDTLAQRYGQLPSAIRGENARDILHLHAILTLGKPPEPDGGAG